MTDKLLAFICALCPFCIARRRYPLSRYAGLMRRAERFCPFCRAYARVYGR